MPANLFTNAKVVEAKSTKAKGAVKTVTEIDGLEKYAAIDHTIKWLKTVLETVKTSVSEHAMTKFLVEGAALGRKPDSFDAKDGDAKANIQLRKRSAASGLTDIEIQTCTEYGIPTETVSDRPETYIFNPEHLEWLAKNAAALSKAIAKLPGAPADLIQLQKATTKVVVTDESVEHLFKTYGKNVEVLTQILPIVTTLAIKPKYEADDADESALKIIEKLIG